jgi:tetratricopeptide (TPR) repeat protein
MYAFIELPPPLDSWVTAPDVLFPMRSLVAAELLSSAVPDPEQILYELERYLDEHPDKEPRFVEAGGQLALRAAVELFTNGLKEESLQFYELSLRLRPGDVITRLNYAIALHALGYRAEALEQYRLLMAQTSPREHLRVWILAAQIHFLHGEYAEVLCLLEPLAEKYFPEDEEFWELLGDANAQAVLAAESGLDNFDYYELKPEVREQWHLPPTPLPVRPERRQQVFPDGGPVDVLALLEELHLFSEQHPELNDLYEPLLGALAYLAGMAAAESGEHEQALHIYEMGLAAEPGSVALRSHYALSLHCLGRPADARRELERVVADTPKGTLLPLVWMMLVRSYVDAGDDAKADVLLKELDAAAPVAKGFRELPQVPPDLLIGPLAGMRCPKCNLEVTPDMRFCSKCGIALTTGSGSSQHGIPH